MRTLRARLLAMIALLVVLVLGVAGFLFSRATRGEIRRLTVNATVAHASMEPIERALQAHYDATGDLRGAKEILDRGAEDKADYVLAGPDGRVLLRSSALEAATIECLPGGALRIAGDRSGIRFRALIERPNAVIRDRARREAVRLYWLERPAPAPAPEAVALRLDRLLLAIFVAVALASVLLAWAIAKRLAAPIERLTDAARRMEAGDLAVSVDAGGGDEIGQLAHAFNAMSSALARNAELHRRLVSDVAHELRTPLTNIIGQLEAIEDGLLEPDAARIASLHDDAVRLSAIVRDLQDLAVADAGGLRLERRLLDAALVARQAASAAEVAAAAKGVALRVRSAGPAFVDGDESRLMQIVRNLVENAVEHTGAGGSIEIDVTEADDEVRISVTDSGAGIPPGELENIFERFYRLDPSRSRASGGTGLGLAIARQLAEAHDGSVRAASEGEGKGAVFTVSLPVARPSS